MNYAGGGTVEIESMIDLWLKLYSCATSRLELIRNLELLYSRQQAISWCFFPSKTQNNNSFIRFSKQLFIALI